MAYTIYIKGAVSDFREREDNERLGFWCYYLRTKNHTELQCNEIKDDGTITTPRMQLMALIEALKACKNIGSCNSVKIYAADHQYLESCLDSLGSRKSNRDLWEKVDKLKLDKSVIAFLGENDKNAEASRIVFVIP